MSFQTGINGAFEKRVQSARLEHSTRKRSGRECKKLRKIKRLNFTFTAGMEEFVKETPMEKTLIHLVEHVAIGNTLHKNVFINCPFDKEYAPILQGMLFCIIYLGFNPRLATERNHSGENRIDKIVELITECQLSIHDLSRCQAQYEGEHFRLNMPLELGIDYGCKSFGKGMQKKSFLILEEQRYRYQAFISDLSGCDIESHNGDFQIAVRKVRNWLTSGGGAQNWEPPKSLAHIMNFRNGIMKHNWKWDFQRKTSKTIQQPNC